VFDAGIRHRLTTGFGVTICAVTKLRFGFIPAALLVFGGLLSPATLV
jgi:hypothetical protein